MVRAPCCEKMGLKKGPWTPEEDQILISYIHKYGHANWRALPKQAGLLRCGKSCRLRWTNYLRPDIKRGNFSREEEETIINLHQMIGNRWSAIAARLPGRTDNEIKNVWHTHLKKRIKNSHENNKSAQTEALLLNSATKTMSTTTSKASINNQSESEPSSSEFSSVTDTSVTTVETKDHVQDMMNMIKSQAMEFSETFQDIDESFWSEALSAENSGNPFEFSDAGNELQHQSSITSNYSVEFCSSSSIDDSMDFWYDLFISNGGSPELPDF